MKIRISELEVGDLFEKLGMMYRVTGKTDKEITYKYCHRTRGRLMNGGWGCKVGIKSQEWVIKYENKEVSAVAEID